MRGHSFVLTLLIIAQIAPALAQSDEASKLERLVQAYPDELATYESGFIVWRDGTKMPVSDGKLQKTFDERLRNASILDQMLLAYPAGPLAQPPGPQDDPGRFRNEAFFDKMYGNCEKGEVQKHLVTIAWLPKSSGAKVKVTTVNEVADKLRAISAEIEALPESLRKYAFPSAGTVNCRPVKDTGKRSMHSYGAAIDLNVTFSDYWLWRKNAPYRNRIPYEIVAIFERHGFIWGGKWGHFDTMHFEYRPELLPKPNGS